MNEEMSADGLLQSAARLVERAIMKLNMNETRCSECSGRHFENRVHAKAYERLTNTPTRLREVAVLLQTGSEPDHQQIVDAAARKTRKR